jgi:hypothetical protein
MSLHEYRFSAKTSGFFPALWIFDPEIICRKQFFR